MSRSFIQIYNQILLENDNIIGQKQNEQKNILIKNLQFNDENKTKVFNGLVKISQKYLEPTDIKLSRAKWHNLLPNLAKIFIGSHPTEHNIDSILNDIGHEFDTFIKIPNFHMEILKIPSLEKLRDANRTFINNQNKGVEKSDAEKRKEMWQAAQDEKKREEFNPPHLSRR